MKYKQLRAYLKSKNIEKDQLLRDCVVVIDGQSYFRDMYKNSECQFILGGEYDRYGSYLKKVLNGFIQSNVQCYVIFSGALDANLERKKEIQQSFINNSINIKPGEDNVYCEPIFVKDVQKQVLEELDIKYYVTEYGNTGAVLSVAKKFRCPVITKNFEYGFFGVSCINPNSLHFDENTKTISCSIYDTSTCKQVCGLPSSVVPIFLTLVDEDTSLYEKLPNLIKYKKPKSMPSVLTWLRRQNSNDLLNSVTKGLGSEAMRKIFLELFDKNTSLCKINGVGEKAAVAHFSVKKSIPVISVIDRKSLYRGIGTGQIAAPYINLINNGTLSGSWLIGDWTKDDAMLATLDIVCYVHNIVFFHQVQNDTITFIGRNLDKCVIWDIQTTRQSILKSFKEWCKDEHSNRCVQKGSDRHCYGDVFGDFWSVTLPGLNVELLNPVPEDCWILIISLVYFCKKHKDFLLFAYAIILSYVMVGPVTEKVGVIKRSNILLSHNQFDEEDKVDEKGLKLQDCVAAANLLMDLFYIKNIKPIFDRGLLHNLAEFQHCLQHVNYFKRLCGGKIKCTVYHRAINVTFVYNVFRKISLKNEDYPMKYFEKRLGNSPVWHFYKNIENAFTGCLSSVQ